MSQRLLDWNVYIMNKYRPAADMRAIYTSLKKKKNSLYVYNARVGKKC